MEEMPSLNMPVQRLKVAILPLDVPCSGLVTHSGEILTTGKSLKGVIDLSKLRNPSRVTSNVFMYCVCSCLFYATLGSSGADIIEMISNLGIDGRP